MEDEPVNAPIEEQNLGASAEQGQEQGDAPGVELDQQDIDVDAERARELAKRQREIGAKMLAGSGFRGRHQEIVDSSFSMARSAGESLAGKNDERRMDAYLSRIDRGIRKYGSRFERQLWEITLDGLVIDESEIPEDYWRAQEQILRDNGQGRELSDQEKDVLAEDIRSKQRESLELWTSYLSHEDCPYPTWFKVYTIDGVSKMGVFDKTKQAFRKRGKGTVAPYPHFNAAVLAKTYSAIADFYGIEGELGIQKDDAQEDQSETQREDGDLVRNAELDALVKSGNFSKLYARLLLSEKSIMETPKNPEDIHGEWVEYGIGDEEAIASAADGTPWCIASPSVAGSYLATGKYGESYDDASDSKAKFILFHLQDKDGRLADNACASIRLDTDGNVAEISGLNDGQALEDSVVQIVEEKVRTLPGGEKFLKKFADKNALIALDRKMQHGEDLTIEEFRFLWELDRPIETLDTYNDSDPRIAELRAKYDAEYAAEHGWIIPDTKIEDIQADVAKYLKNDLGLRSNMLTYVLKQKLAEDPDYLTRLLSEPEITSQLRDGQADEILEHIRSLEVLETEHYIFLLPTDTWEQGKIELPESSEAEYIAPQDLTAILKAPVVFDWAAETNGAIMDDPFVVYHDGWVGKEIRHFPWSKELFAAQDQLLRPNGFEIPNSWADVLSRDITSDELQSNYALSKNGAIWEGRASRVGYDGGFWSASLDDEEWARGLGFYFRFARPSSFIRCSALSVRCVSVPKP